VLQSVTETNAANWTECGAAGSKAVLLEIQQRQAGDWVPMPWHSKPRGGRRATTVCVCKKYMIYNKKRFGCIALRASVARGAKAGAPRTATLLFFANCLAVSHWLIGTSRTRRQWYTLCATVYCDETRQKEFFAKTRLGR
jgi:hypothetical protein